MKNAIFPAFLAIALLTACTPAMTPAPTRISVPMTVPPTSTVTAEVIPAIMTPSPIPTQPSIMMITPDKIQVERWKEYEDALAQSILPMFPLESILCEWDILGQSSQEVYVWADCAVPGKGDDGLPAVIHLNADNSVQNAEVPGRGSGWSADVQRMFPADVREKFGLDFANYIFYRPRKQEMLQHLVYRATHPEEPPLIVLSATPTP